MRFQHRKSVRSALPMHLQIGHNILLSSDLLLPFPHTTPCHFEARAGTSKFHRVPSKGWHIAPF